MELEKLPKVIKPQLYPNWWFWGVFTGCLGFWAALGWSACQIWA